MDKIKIENETLQLIPMLEQTYDGRTLRLSGTRNVANDKWINGVFKSHTIHDFIYTDDQGGQVSFEFNYENKFVKKL